MTYNARWRILVVAVLMIMFASLPFAHSTRPIIDSVWAVSPPSIDGKFTPGEWANPQIVFQVPPYPSNYLNAYVYFANDHSRLYVLVDAVGDETDDWGDENLLVFIFPGQAWIEFWGVGGQVCASPGQGEGWGCNIPKGILGVVGYDASPNSGHKHKMYEVSIPLANINAIPGQSVDFCSPKKPTGGSISYDDKTGRDNVWPQGLVISKIDTWGILVLQQETLAMTLTTTATQEHWTTMISTIVSTEQLSVVTLPTIGLAAATGTIGLVVGLMLGRLRRCRPQSSRKQAS